MSRHDSITLILNPNNPSVLSDTDTKSFTDIMIQPSEIHNVILISKIFTSVIPVFEDQKVIFKDRWSLFIGNLFFKTVSGPNKVESLFIGGL